MVSQGNPEGLEAIFVYYTNTYDLFRVISTSLTSFELQNEPQTP